MTEICNVYGQTESYGNCCVTPHDWPLERERSLPGAAVAGRDRSGSTDPATDAVLPTGEDGLIEVRGYLMRGYRQQRQIRMRRVMTSRMDSSAPATGRPLSGRQMSFVAGSVK